MVAGRLHKVLKRFDQTPETPGVSRLLVVRWVEVHDQKEWLL